MAWRFVDTVSGGVSLADNAALSFPDGDWSCGGWVKLDHNVGSDFQYFVSWNGFAATPSWQLYFSEHTQGTNDFLYWNSSDDDGTAISALVSTTTPGTSTLWQHVMIVRDTVNNLFRMYVNGVQVSTTADTNYNGCNCPDPLYFGLRGDDDNADRRLDGCMAEWAKWDRLLTVPEILALAGGYSPLFYINNIKWYLPMIRDYTEQKEGIVVTDTASAVENHPPIVYPSGLLIPVAPTVAVSGNAGIMTTNTGFWGATY